MTELAHKMERLRGQVQVPWTAGRSELARRGIRRRHQRRRVLGAGAAVAGVLLLALLAPRLVPRLEPGAALPVAGVPAPQQLQDGSVVAALTPDTEVQTQEQTPGRIVVRLVRGSARFRVTRDVQRLFRVLADDVAVEVLGTEFIVTRAARQTQVNVERGRVRVRWEGGTAELSAGEQGSFPSAPDSLQERLTADPPTAVPTPAPPTQLATEEPKAEPVEQEPASAQAALGLVPTVPHRHPQYKGIKARRSWQDLAHAGQFEQAYTLLSSVPLTAAAREPGELLLAADVARLSRHPAQSVEPLRRVIVDHAADPRASLAAFTLGRILLDDLGRPKEAAGFFGKTQELDPRGDLTEDALAREVEAWWRAGDTAQAQERAAAYVRRYPDGRHLLSVRHYGAVQ